ncbi:putative NAD(P)-binding protein [Sediminihabitans luteus]|uniref:Putative NAD(P)-binding protein n=1 Tax=Sediminihabitans luteus TaxID=1138585 RepID=A0A2M9CEW5_9CELL|nr:NAD(P)H-binding protein [Sediminihabitans luteus]PJJ70395.1 putative NAD(P)-binding protein [Sediminihabitans luteus]GII97867.1 NAD-dependent dehydratase [Sediminihabitans luteus]
MRVVIAGAHGQIGRRLARALNERGDSIVGLVRSASQIVDITDLGAEVALMDLEQDDAPTLASILTDADAVVFAAGAGPGSGAARKDTVDRAGAVLLADAAEIAGVRRYVLISSMGVESVRGGARPAGVDAVFLAYLQAKAAAESDLLARDTLDLTILRPGRLTDDDATGTVTMGTDLGRGDVSRDDVALVVAEVLHEPRTAGVTVDVLAGTTRVDDAVYRSIPAAVRDADH